MNKDRFEARLKAIEGKSKPGSRVETRVMDDGLVVDVVKADRRTIFPIKGLLIAGLIIVALKGFLFAQLGETEYVDRIDRLSQGSTVEVAAAFLLDADPATRMLASLLGPTFR